MRPARVRPPGIRVGLIASRSGAMLDRKDDVSTRGCAGIGRLIANGSWYQVRVSCTCTMSLSPVARRNAPWFRPAAMAALANLEIPFSHLYSVLQPHHDDALPFRRGLGCLRRVTLGNARGGLREADTPGLAITDDERMPRSPEGPARGRISGDRDRHREAFIDCAVVRDLHVRINGVAEGRGERDARGRRRGPVVRLHARYRVELARGRRFLQFSIGRRRAIQIGNALGGHCKADDRYQVDGRIVEAAADSPSRLLSGAHRLVCDAGYQFPCAPGRLRSALMPTASRITGIATPIDPRHG